jgi:hypothetical protein
MVSVEVLFMMVSTVSAIAGFVSFVSILEAHRANREAYEVAKKIWERMEAAATLIEVQALLKQGKMFKAMDRLGMIDDLVDDMTLEEAQQVFAVRVADLQKKAKGVIDG